MELAEVVGDAPGAGIGDGVARLFVIVVVGKVVDVVMAAFLEVLESHVVGGR